MKNEADIRNELLACFLKETGLNGLKKHYEYARWLESEIILLKTPPKKSDMGWLKEVIERKIIIYNQAIGEQKESLKKEIMDLRITLNILK